VNPAISNGPPHRYQADHSSENRRAIILTFRGEARAVLTDVGTYDRSRSSLALLELLARGEADAAADRLTKQANVFRRARKAIRRSSADDQSPLPGRGVEAAVHDLGKLIG
jgi:hypothetical protein